jgi:hypothetical protein
MSSILTAFCFMLAGFQHGVTSRETDAYAVTEELPPQELPPQEAQPVEAAQVPSSPPYVVAVAAGTVTAVLGMTVLAASLPALLMGGTLAVGAILGGPAGLGSVAVMALLGGVALGGASLVFLTASLGMGVSGLFRCHDLIFPVSGERPLPIGLWERGLQGPQGPNGPWAARGGALAFSTLTLAAGLTLLAVYSGLVAWVAALGIPMLVLGGGAAVLAAVAGVAALVLWPLTWLAPRMGTRGNNRACAPSVCPPGPLPSGTPEGGSPQSAKEGRPQAGLHDLDGFTLPWAVGARLALRGFQGVVDNLGGAHQASPAATPPPASVVQPRTRRPPSAALNSPNITSFSVVGFARGAPHICWSYALPL